MAPKKNVSIPVVADALKGKSVIITGNIEGMTRKDAEQILINAGAKIEKSLNKKVELVVLGEDAGPKKMEKIEELGLETKDWDDLIEEISTEDPANPAEGDGHQDEEKEDTKPTTKAQPKAESNTKKKADPAPKAKAKSSASDSSISGKTVIITGTVSGHDRASADAIIEKAGATVAKSLNRQVELVILGTNPGPDKVKKAEEDGIETISWNDLAKKLDIEIIPEKKVAEVDAGEAPDSIEGKTVIITGTVEGHTRAEAQKLLEAGGAKVAKSMNKSVELVALGVNPGPDKLNKIADAGIPTCSFEALVKKLDLETKIQEPPKKKARTTRSG